MKTIFITSFNPFIGRNILSTEVLSQLADTVDLKIIIFCPAYKQNYFKDNFASDNVVIEGVATETRSRQDIIFSYIGRSLISTKTLAIHRWEIFLKNKNIITFIFSIFLAALGKLEQIKKIVRWLDLATINKSRFSVYFDKYQPSLIFATDIFHVDDAHFLAEAHYRGINTVGMVRSWDNITNKGLFRIRPNKVIASNNTIKKEVLAYEDTPEQDIFVSGWPQFDYYSKPAIAGRGEFFRRTGLNPDKKTILFAPLGQRFKAPDHEIVKILKELPFQFIIRLPPNDTASLPELDSGNFFINHPGISFKPGVYRDREITLADVRSLAEELTYSDVVVSYPSTLVLDAVAFSKQVIIVAFDGDKINPYLKSSRRFLDFTHINKLLSVGCFLVSRNKKEFLSHITSLLAGGKKSPLNRTTIIQDHIAPWDGRAGIRIAEFLLDNLTGFKK